MKKLGKKIHNHQETIEAYACSCSGCAYCYCGYGTCGNNTAVMANVYTSNFADADNYVSYSGYITS